MDQNKFKALLENEEFLTKILDLETPEDVQAAFKEEGVDISLDEANALGKAIVAQASGKELSAEELDAVAGGNVINAIRELSKQYFKNVKESRRKLSNRF